MRTKSGPSGQSTPTFIEAARRAQIIQAALDTIAEVGFAQASLSRIAARAGISKGVIGYYFPSKDDLVRAAVDHFYLAGHEEMMAELGSATSPVAMLETYIRSNVAYINRNRIGTRAIGEIIANFRKADGTPVYRIEDTEPLVKGTEALFAWGQETGEFRLFDTRVMALTLRAAVDAFGQQLAAYPETNVGAYAEQLVALFTAATRNEAIPAAKVRLKASKQEG